MVSTAAFHARVRGSVPGLGGLKETKMFLPHPRVKVSIVGSLRDREVACSASDRQGSNFESCVWRTVSSQSSHHPQEVLLAQFSLYVHKSGLKPDSFHFFSVDLSVMTVIANDVDSGNNGSVMYSLKQVPMKGSQPLFSIDTYTGLISTRLDNALDRETQPEYTLIVQAQDRGSPAESCEYDHRMNMELLVALTTLMSTTVDIM